MGQPQNEKISGSLGRALGEAPGGAQGALEKAPGGAWGARGAPLAFHLGNPQFGGGGVVARAASPHTVLGCVWAPGGARGGTFSHLGQPQNEKISGRLGGRWGRRLGALGEGAWGRRSRFMRATRPGGPGVQPIAQLWWARPPTSRAALGDQASNQSPNPGGPGLQPIAQPWGTRPPTNRPTLGDQASNQSPSPGGPGLQPIAQPWGTRPPTNSLDDHSLDARFSKRKPLVKGLHPHCWTILWRPGSPRANHWSEV